MAITTVRPNDTQLNTGMTRNGGAASDHVTLNDNNDATYMSSGNTDSLPVALITGLGTVTATATQRIKQVRVRMRMKGFQSTTSGSIPLAYVHLRDGATGVDTPADMYQFANANWVTYTGAWRTLAPDGGVWTQTKLNDAQLKIYDTRGNGVDWPGNAVFFYAEAYIDVDVNNQPTVSVTAPTGTQTTTKPTVTWTYTDTDGDLQTRYHVKIFSQDQYSEVGFDPSTSTAVYDAGERSGAVTSFAIPVDINNGTYRAYVRVGHEMPSGGAYYSSWQFSSYTTDLQTAPAPAIDITVEDISLRTKLDLLGYLNLLGKGTADPESGAIGMWVNGGSSTTTGSTDQAFQGSGSLKSVATAAANATVITSSGTSGFIVQPSTPYRLQMKYYPLTNARSLQVNIRWYDSAGAQISLVGGTLVSAGNQTPNTWNTYTQEWTSPSNAAYARLDVFFTATTVGDTYYYDQFMFVPMVAGEWNLVPNPSFDENTGNWTLLGGSVRKTDIPGQQGNACVFIGRTSAIFTVALGQVNIPAVAGTQYTLSWWVKPVIDASGQVLPYCRIETRDAADAVVLPRIDTRLDVGTVVGEWRRQSVTFIAPAGTVTIDIQFVLDGASPTWPFTGKYAYIDAVQMETAAARTPWQDRAWFRGGLIHATNLRYLIEYSDDGGTTWKTLRTVTPGVDQKITEYDYTAPPGRIRQYRATSITFDSVDLVGSPGPPQEQAAAQGLGDKWYLKDPDVPDDVVEIDVVPPFAVTEDEAMSVFHPLESMPIVVSQKVYGEDGELHIQSITEANFQALKKLYQKQKVLLLQSGPLGDQWWIRLKGGRMWSMSLLPVRDITLPYVEVDPP